MSSAPPPRVDLATATGDTPAAVPEVRVPAPGTTSAYLVFGTGRLDEPFARGGVVHLLEHLVMRRLGSLDIEANATTAPHHLSFEAHGTPVVVKEFLERVVAAIAGLGTLTDAEVLAEKRVIDHELRSWSPHPSLYAIRERLGVRGEALGAVDPPGRCFLTTDEVVDHARRHLVRENAVLVVVGDAPEGIDLGALPTAVSARPLRSALALLPLATPGSVARRARDRCRRTGAERRGTRRGPGRRRGQRRGVPGRRGRRDDHPGRGPRLVGREGAARRVPRAGADRSADPRRRDLSLPAAGSVTRAAPELC